MKLTRQKLRRLIRERLELLSETKEYDWEGEARHKLGDDTVTAVIDKGYVIISDSVWEKAQEAMAQVWADMPSSPPIGGGPKYKPGTG